MNGNLPQGWRMTRLGEIAEINPRPRRLVPSEPISFVSMSDVSEDGSLVQAAERLVSGITGGMPQFQTGDTLLAKITPCFENGKGAFIDILPTKYGYGSTEFHVIRATDLADPRYLFWITRQKQFRRLGTQNMTGSAGQRRVPSEFVKSFPIALPPKHQQRKISEVLTSIGHLISTSSRMIDQIRSFNRALTIELLTKGLPGKQTNFKETVVGPIPEHWTVVSLDDLGEDGWPSIRTGPFGSSLKSSHFKPQGVPVITIATLGEGALNQKELFFTDEQTAHTLHEYAVREGDIVFSRVADIGRSALIELHQEGWIISSNLMRICLNKRRANPAFIRNSIVESPLIQKQLQDNTSGAGRMLVTSRDMKRIQFPFPPLVEQEEISAMICDIAERITAEEATLNSLIELRHSLCSTLLAGKLPVSFCTSEIQNDEVEKCRS